MARISEIKWKGAEKRRARIYLDGEFWMTLSMEVIESLGFYPGYLLSDEHQEEVETRIVEENAKLFLMRSLNWKMQSRAQLARKLVEREVPKEIADRALDRMVEIGLLDDWAVAESVARGLHDRGYGRRRAQMKLQEIGIASEQAAEALAAIYNDEEDEEVERALAAIGSRYRTSGDAQRAFGFLVRRGFDMSVASKAVKLLPAADEEQ